MTLTTALSLGIPSPLIFLFLLLNYIHKSLLCEYLPTLPYLQFERSYLGIPESWCFFQHSLFPLEEKSNCRRDTKKNVVAHLLPAVAQGGAGQGVCGQVAPGGADAGGGAECRCCEAQLREDAGGGWDVGVGVEGACQDAQGEFFFFFSSSFFFFVMEQEFSLLVYGVHICKGGKKQRWSLLCCGLWLEGEGQYGNVGG